MSDIFCFNMQISQNKFQQSPQKNQNKQSLEQSSNNSNDVQFDPDDSNQKFFNLADVKQLDLKAAWLGNTNQIIKKYEVTKSQLQKQKMIMKEGFQVFQQNQKRFKINSLRNINFHFDRQQLLRQYLQKSRRPIQKLHPSLIINIVSYIEQNVFFGMAKMRRVSQIFNLIYNNADVIKFFAQKYLGNSLIDLKEQEQICQRYVSFVQTLLYYKQIKYTILIPQNSIKQDLEDAINFINDIYKRTFQLKNTDFQYFDLLNNFMKKHRVVLALQSLSFSDMAVTRKISIVAFSNYLAFNPNARKKQEITKTKYLKMIQMISDEDYRDSLVINSKISNFLLEEYNYQFSVFVDTLRSIPTFIMYEETVFNLVVYHHYNELKSYFLKGVALQDWRIQVNDVALQFSQDLEECRLNYRQSGIQQSQIIMKHYMPTFDKNTNFGHCYIYRGQYYYIILIKCPQLTE